ncbi:hypothetical protein [Natronobacterium texcoconense]|uniref:Uncharacterized protein n=1 Tax=Natronobacterium texcoconense TaxID=1095778 RepID=A0A1H1EBK8_NATTX|nr:hypothetical protein [Natronobacterium texcoconense]SDQ86135.1 hypothetical protein SAMN04489842_1526 [Natronobacterium texcoconense]
MTNATANSNENDTDLFDTRFSIGAAVVSAISFVLALLFIWTGFQEAELLIVGTELTLVSGLAGMMLLLLVSVTSLFAALYMEPGFDH